MLIGESWGAMLALAYGAAHPEDLGPMILVGCGTFDPVSRSKIGETLAGRIDPELRRQLGRLPDEISDPQARMKRQYQLCSHLYDFDCAPAAVDDQAPPFDVKAHTETWRDMVRLQDAGVYPAAFAAIKSPVLMLHGDHDPHPGTMIRDNLLPHLPRLEYHQWGRCGHSPWRERNVRDQFFTMVKQWLAGHLST
jgi:pimeloyl-ACP methyl ester carboxylesterase